MLDFALRSTILWIAVVIGLTYCFYRYILRPYLQYRHYRQILTRNYKVKVIPFTLLSIFMMRRNKEDLEKHGDSQHSIKYDYRNYQVVLSSFQRNIFLDFIDPQLIREFFEKTLEGCYVKYKTFPFMKSLKSLIGEGLLFSEGNEWKRKKKIMSNVFNFDFIKSKIQNIFEISHEILDSIERQQANQDQNQITLDVTDMLQRIFGNVVIRCFFGDIMLDKIEGQPIFEFTNRLMQLNTQRTLTAFYILFTFLHKFNLRSIDRQVASMKLKFEAFAQRIIQQQLQAKASAKQEGDRSRFGGIIELLIHQNKLVADTQKRGQQVRECYSHSQLIDEFKTFFMAGTDTTANNTTILIYQLAKYPDILKRVRQEIQSVLPPSTKDITYEHLKQLTFLEKVQKETLRMFSPTAGIFMREATKDHYIGSIPIKKGTLVSIKIKPNHFKEQFYENPQVFNPDRWDTIDKVKTDPYSFFPFSSGQRNCIGQHLALMQSKIALISILTRYSQIKLQNPEFRLYMRTLYGAEKMKTTFVK